MDPLQELRVLLTAGTPMRALVPTLSVCDGSCVSQYLSDPYGQIQKWHGTAQNKGKHISDKLVQ